MKIKIPLLIIKLEEENYHILVSSVLPDGEKGLWAVDTGASKTVFDKALAQKYSIVEKEDENQTAGIGESPVQVTTGILKNFSVGRFKTGEIEVALIDLSHINSLYLKAVSLQICGLIGSDFLMKNNAVIDYKRRVLILQ